MSNSGYSLAMAQVASPPETTWLDRIARKGIHAALGKLERGEITLVEGDREHVFGDPARGEGLRVRVQVLNPACYRAMALGGSIGAGEAYMRGDFTCSDLTALVRIFLMNREVLDGMDAGWTRLKGPIFKALHWFNRNTREGSRRNIAAHYDLGNDFYRLFLDETMMYSSGVYMSEDSTLLEASVEKLDRICRKLELKPTDHLIEIGTGWGGFALHAAGKYGCRVTTTTISKEQHAMAVERVRAAGLEDRVEVLLEDYRDLKGTYDKLVSIEMIEAVGLDYLDGYFQKCASLLKPEGMMAIQAITIADQHYERAKNSVDFIQRYIFPGGALPSVGAMAASIASATDLRIFHLEDIGPHYAQTLRDWRHRFMMRLPEVRQLGFSESFIRMWEYYLCYCEGGFLERSIGTVQLVMTKPECRRSSIL